MPNAQTDAAAETGNVIHLFRHKRALAALSRRRLPQPTEAQTAWLARGLDMPSGGLPLFDTHGQRIDERTVRSCLRKGWAEPWFQAPEMSDWLVCKLTAKGRAAVAMAAS